MSYNPYSIIVLQFVSFDKTNTNITIKIKIHSKLYYTFPEMLF